LLLDRIQRKLRVPSKVRMLCGATVVADNRLAAWRRVSAFRWYELETDLFLKAFLRRGDNVADVGAHEGVLTVLAAKLVGPSGRVHAFEPSASLRSVVDRVAELNELSNVVTNDCAISDSNGFVHFTSSGAGYAKQCAEGGEHRIRSTTLDSYCDAHGIAGFDLIKVDVDGPELLALKGAERLLESDRAPALVIEVSNETRRLGYAPGDILDHVQSHGYEVFGARMKFPHALPIEKLDDFHRLPVDLEKGEVANIFCLKRDLHFSRLFDRIWPEELLPESYGKHFCSSSSPYESPSEFWSSYQRELFRKLSP